MTNYKQIQMDKTASSKQYDLEGRTLEFAGNVRRFVKKLPKTIGNLEDAKQLIRSSGSIGANYIEANEALSKKDLCVRARIARKEAKETRYWLKLIDAADDPGLEKERDLLVQESSELLKILSSIVNKVTERVEP